MAMFIAGSEVNYTYGALEIFVSGCTRGCEGCHNPELQSFGVGKKWQRWLRDNRQLIDGGLDLVADKIWIMGGDLLCQPITDAIEFLKAIRKIAPKTQVVIWTGEEEYSDIDPDLLALVDGVKMGAYIRKFASDTYYSTYLSPKGEELDIKLASTNQRFVF